MKNTYMYKEYYEDIYPQRRDFDTNFLKKLKSFSV